MSTEKAVYLLTGANRGIGLAITKQWLARPNTVVIAAVRNPSHPTSVALSSLPRAEGTELITVKLDHGVESDPTDAVKELKEKHGITKVDILLPNAGIASEVKYPILDITAESLKDVLDINTFAIIRILKAFIPLLCASANPRFIAMSSPLASHAALGQVPRIDNAYPISKILVNYITAQLHFEQPWLTSFAISPGWVDTDMGRSEGGVPPLSAEDSAKGLATVAESATRETRGGTLANYDGGEWPW